MICSISGIRLPLSAIQVLETQHKKYCRAFFRRWVHFAGRMLYDGESIEDPLLFADAAQPSSVALHDLKTAFFQHEFNQLLELIVGDSVVDDIHAMTYAKVLIGACLRHDAILAGILITECHLCTSLLIGDPQIEVPNREFVFDCLMEFGDLLMASFSILAYDDTENAIAFLNTFGKISVQSALLFTSV